MATFQQIQAHGAVRPARRARTATAGESRPWPGAAKLAFIMGASGAGWLLIGLAARRIL